MAFVDDIRGFEFKVLNRLSSTFRALGDSYDRQRSFKATFNALNALSERELDDLGLARGDIAAVAYEAAYGK